MISKKTASLLQACCVAGAICADASDEEIEKIGYFGIDLGMAFQIRDDILDIFGDEKEFGKKIGKDIIEKKMGNFIILTALEQLGDEDRKYTIGLLDSSDGISDDEIKQVTSLIEKTTARQIAEDTAGKYIQTALDSLSQLPQNEYSQTLGQIADYIVSRES
jgi:geranylgeranyl pyrophosphate synthase